MKQLLRIFLLVSITALMASCKLAIIVVEGGEVQSTGSGTCVASTICIVDVTDPNFSEKFTAVPDDGWYFEKWNSGDGFFCGGSSDSECALSFQGYEESKAVEDVVASSETFYLMPVFRPSEITSVDGKITVNGKQWLQPADFGGYSHNQVSAVCPGGVCSGYLPGSTFDLTGYMWASSDDFNALAEAYRKEGKGILADFEYLRDKNSGFLYALLSDPHPPDKSSDDDGVFATIAVIAGSVTEPNKVSEVVGIIHSSASMKWTGAWFWK